MSLKGMKNNFWKIIIDKSTNRNFKIIKKMKIKMNKTLTQRTLYLLHSHLQIINGPNINKNKLLNLLTWVSFKKFNKTKMILVLMILAYKTKNPQIPKVKKVTALMAMMMIFLEIKGQRESSR